MNVSKGDLALIIGGYYKFYIGSTCVVLDSANSHQWNIEPSKRMPAHKNAEYFVIKDAHLRKICEPPKLSEKAIDRVIEDILK